jgi:hypothetical protein
MGLFEPAPRPGDPGGEEGAVRFFDTEEAD